MKRVFSIFLFLAAISLAAVAQEPDSLKATSTLTIEEIQADEPQQEEEDAQVPQNIAPISGSNLSAATEAYFAGDYEKAAALAEGMRTKSATAHMLLSRSYLHLEMRDSARVNLLRCLDLDPDNAAAFQELAALSLEDGDHENAAAYARELLLRQPDSRKANEILGTALLRLDSLEAAQPYLQKAYAQNQGSIDLALLLAQSLMADESIFPQNARELLEATEDKLLHENNPLGEVYASMARGFYNEQNWQQALHYYEKAAEIYPEDIRFLYGMGFCHEQLEHYQLAKEYYEKYLARAASGTREYELVQQNLEYVNLELFMNL